MKKKEQNFTHSTGQLTTEDNVQLFYQSWLPQAKPKAVVVIVHGLAEHSSRYAHVAQNLTSKGYIFLMKLIFWVHFSDAQCGFKAVSRKIVTDIIPHIEDNEWFFDSELLIITERLGYRIYEEPVTWIDNPGSTVRVWKTAIGDLKGLYRLFITRPWRFHPSLNKLKKMRDN